MPGSNGNSTLSEGMELFEGIAKSSGNKEKIDKKNEFKDFEKVIANKDLGGKEVLVQEVTKDQGKVLNLFEEGDLTNKAKEAKDENKPKDVQNAYKILLAYKNGKAGSYDQVLEQVEQEETLDEAKQRILNMIDKNSDWSNPSKRTAKKVVEDIFEECNSVDEFERRAGVTLATVELMDNIGDFFRAIPEAIYKTAEKYKAQREEIVKETQQFMEELGYKAEEVWNNMIERGIAEWNNYVEYCKKKGQKMKDIAKTICERGKEQFSSFLSYLEGIKEGVEDALSAAWEWTGKQWDSFMELCAGARDSVKAFGIKLIEKGELAWQNFVEGLKNDREKVKETCKYLLDQGLIKLNDFAERCKGVGEKGKELLVSILEGSKQLVKDFVNRCTENWESAKSWFKDVCKSMLEKGKMLVSEFVELCKNSWELVKETACNVLVSLVAVGKIALRVAFDALIVLPAVAVAELTKLLITAGKEVFKKTAELGKFIGELAIIGREKAKSLGNTFVDYMKDYMKGVMDTIKGLGIKLDNIIEGLFKTMRQGLEKAGIAVSDFIKATYDVVRTALKNIWDTTATFFRNLGMNAKDVIVTLWEASKMRWKNMVDYTLNTLKSIGLSIKEGFKFLIEKCKVGIDTIGTLLMKAGEHVAEFINYVKELGIITYERIKQWCNNQVEKIKLFIRTAIDACKATRNNLVEWCGGRVEQIKNILVELYGKTKEGLKNLIRFIGGAVLEAGKFILQLGIAVPALMVLVLKELGEGLEAITKLFVETLVKYGKMAVSALCDALTEAFGKTKEMIIRIGQAVANFLKSSAESIRAWILKKTNDAVQAIKAMESYIKENIGDLCNWLYEQGLAVKDIAKTIMTAFKGQAKAIVAGVKAFYDLCKNKLNMGRSEFKKAWNSGVESAADYLTID